MPIFLWYFPHMLALSTWLDLCSAMTAQATCDANRSAQDAPPVRALDIDCDESPAREAPTRHARRAKRGRVSPANITVTAPPAPPAPSPSASANPARRDRGAPSLQ